MDEQTQPNKNRWDFINSLQKELAIGGIILFVFLSFFTLSPMGRFWLNDLKSPAILVDRLGRFFVEVSPVSFTPEMAAKKALYAIESGNKDLYRSTLRPGLEIEIPNQQEIPMLGFTDVFSTDQKGGWAEVIVWTDLNVEGESEPRTLLRLVEVVWVRQGDVLPMGSWFLADPNNLPFDLVGLVRDLIANQE